MSLIYGTTMNYAPISDILKLNDHKHKHDFLETNIDNSDSSSYCAGVHQPTGYGCTVHCSELPGVHIATGVPANNELINIVMWDDGIDGVCGNELYDTVKIDEAVDIWYKLYITDLTEREIEKIRWQLKQTEKLIRNL